MSSALPAGGPSRISVNTTSANSRSTMRCAVVEPTNPPPTTVTFFLLILISVNSVLSALNSFLLFHSTRIDRAELLCDCHTLHVFDDRGCECRSADFGCARHEAFEVVSDFLLLNRARDAVFDQLSRFFPAKEFEHHRAREHDRAGIDDIFIRVLRRGAVRRFKHAVTVADVRSRRHAEPADLRSAGVGEVIAI